MKILEKMKNECKRHNPNLQAPSFFSYCTLLLVSIFVCKCMLMIHDLCMFSFFILYMSFSFISEGLVIESFCVMSFFTALIRDNLIFCSQCEDHPSTVYCVNCGGVQKSYFVKIFRHFLY
jgi:hypothetical protein